MKAVILAGGLGTRITEETTVRPKPMVEIGGKPILWHIMKIYYAHGIKDFIVCCGYKGHFIKEFFANYLLYMSDVTFDTKQNKVEILQKGTEEWRVTLVDTGETTMTGGRIRRARDYIGNDTFCLTYGDGVTDADIGAVMKFHREQGAFATLLAVQPPGRFGAFTLSDDNSKIDHFREKPRGDDAWINGGFFVVEPEVFDYIDGDSTVWEQEPLSRLARDNQLSAYKHDGFWQSMDTLRDKHVLEELWDSGNPPWRIW